MLECFIHHSGGPEFYLIRILHPWRNFYECLKSIHEQVEVCKVDSWDLALRNTLFRQED